MKPNPISVAAALLLAACTTDIRDEMPGQAGADPAVQAQAPAQSARTQSARTQSAGLKTWRQLQDEANAQSIEPTRSSRKASDQQSQTPRSQTQSMSQAQDQQQQQQQQQPPVRRRGSSSPPPPPVAQQVPQGLPPVGSTEAMTDRFKRDLMSPEVDRLRTEDAMGRLDPLQQRELFRKEQDLRQYGTGPRGY